MVRPSKRVVASRLSSQKSVQIREITKKVERINFLEKKRENLMNEVKNKSHRTRTRTQAQETFNLETEKTNKKSTPMNSQKTIQKNILNTPDLKKKLSECLTETEMQKFFNSSPKNNVKQHNKNDEFDETNSNFEPENVGFTGYRVFSYNFISNLIETICNHSKKCPNDFVSIEFKEEAKKGLWDIMT